MGPATAGDVDGDGHDDLIVGAWQHGSAAISEGRAYLYSGKDGSLLKTYTCRIPGDTFGFDAVAMGDIDGDGTINFLITSAWSGIHGFHSDGCSSSPVESGGAESHNSHLLQFNRCSAEKIHRRASGGVPF